MFVSFFTSIYQGLLSFFGKVTRVPDQYDAIVTARWLSNSYDAGGGSGAGGSRDRGMYYDSLFLDDGPPQEGGGGVEPANIPPRVDDKELLPAVVLQGLKTAINEVHERINIGDSVPFLDGSISLGEFYAAWMYWDISITYNIDYGTNAGGAMTGGGTEPGLTYINDQTVKGYFGSFAGRSGLHFLVVHEALHATTSATNHINQVYNSWYEGATDKSDNAWRLSAPFIQNEQLINRTARDVLIKLGIPAIASPPLGYGE